MASEPIWKRQGFSTRNQYRSAKAREQINPETGKPFTSYRQQRDYQAKSKGTPRNYAAERQRADTRAQSRGYASSSREQNVKRALKDKWGVSWDDFNSMRRQNRNHWRDVRGGVSDGKLPENFPTFLHKYEEPKGANAVQWVGYIVSYYHAIVDDKHNWQSVRDDSGRWEISEHEGRVVPKSDIWWYRHFVIYSNKRSANYYEARYGYIL